MQRGGWMGTWAGRPVVGGSGGWAAVAAPLRPFLLEVARPDGIDGREDRGATALTVD